MKLLKSILSIALTFTATTVAAENTEFDNFTAMTGDVGESTLPEAAPYRIASPKITQISIVARGDTSNEVPGSPARFDSGNYDMHTANETGPDAGRYLFTVYETGQPGIQRTDLRTMITTTIWQSPAVDPGATVAGDTYRSFDASRWTPWGSFLTAEESWSDPGAAVSKHGRLFEVTNPLADAADIDFVHRDILPRVSHEGLAFDSNNNLYFIDERNDSHIFKFTSVNPRAKNGDDFFAGGQTFVLRVGDGTVKEATGSARWIAITDVHGNPLPGAVVVTDPNGLAAIDGRATPKLDAFRGTAFDRPEDMEIKTFKNRRQVLYVATTTNNKVFAIDLRRTRVELAVSRDTTDMATGDPVGMAFTSPDNIAIDAEGNIYIVEDQPGGVEDIWFLKDRNNDGVAEAIGKWASLSTAGAESTGLYFDLFNPNVAYINVQHPDSDVDRTVMLIADQEARGNDTDDHDQHHGHDGKN